MKLSILTVTIVFCTVILLNGCSREKPQFADFIGLWCTANGDTIRLMEDSCCIVRNMRDPNNTEDSIAVNFVGKWDFKASGYWGYDRPIVVLFPEKSLYSKMFFVSGQGLFNNRPPWYFFRYIGDPDDLNEYAFRKVQ
ncbi:MAG: hypothetical protein LBM06_00165 [Prevotellaceae bacterium]|jgi:hypothetical protein|nr:hypothetical protein [Prevotellaceae bacterium]